MKHLFFTFLLAVLSLNAIAQTKHTISGFIRDSLSSESLIGATVYNSHTLAGTSANRFGFYSLTLPEGSSGLYVRGGGPDQNLILLDGVPIYNVSHLFGFFSVFNADAVNNMELIKGGFPARYGGRTSSVLDINLKEGNLQKFGGEGAVGLVATKLTLEGPIVKDRSQPFKSVLY
ncbi:MAG: TonB-dependent receptor [Bacteroidales bacterium]|jgi:hypothetical protein|nr:TonB-dependent receptor [Bacteroidales bacterium]